MRDVGEVTQSSTTGPRAIARAATARLAILAAVCVAFVLAGYVIAVRTSWGQRIDANATLNRHAHTRAVHAAGRVLGTISVSSLAIALGVLCIVAVVRRRPRLALVAGVAIMGAVVTTELLKRQVFHRVALHVAGRSENTYPSGHTTVAMSVAIAAMLVAPRRWRGTILLLGAGYASAVGIATVTAGWHRPSDVIAAFAVAVGWGAAAAAFSIASSEPDRASRTRARATTDDSETSRVAVVLAVGGGALAVGALTVFVEVIVVRAHELVVIDRGHAFAAAVAAIAAAAALFSAALLGALRHVALVAPPPPKD